VRCDDFIQVIFRANSSHIFTVFYDDLGDVLMIAEALKQAYYELAAQRDPRKKMI